MYAFSYLEMNTCCIILMLVVLRVHLRSLDKSASANVFTMLLCSMLCYTGVDLLCGLIENDFVPTTQLASSIINVLFFCSSYTVSYLSFVYAEYELGHFWVHDRNKRLLSAIPVFVMTILTFLTLKWKFFFYIDEAGNYIKGPLYVLMLLGAYGYIIATAINMFYHLAQKQYYIQRRKLLTLASFVSFPLIAGVLQAFHTGISIIAFGGTIAMVQVFINLQDTRITMDPLTGVNNRTRLMQVLETQMASAGKKTLYFIMLDIDRFKDINDQYGHTEGDIALMAVAQVLRDVCGDYSGILARYGGDEFAVVLTPATWEEPTLIEAFQQSIRLSLQEYNRTANKPYQLTVSIGYAKRTEALNSIPALIAAADKDMYAEKKNKKGGSRR